MKTLKDKKDIPPSSGEDAIVILPDNLPNLPTVAEASEIVQSIRSSNNIGGNGDEDENDEDEDKNRSWSILMNYLWKSLFNTIIRTLRRVWSEVEDETIRKAVAKLGTKSWALIAETISKEYGVVGRSGKQCRERWHNHLGIRNKSF